MNPLGRTVGALDTASRRLTPGPTPEVSHTSYPLPVGTENLLWGFLFRASALRRFLSSTFSLKTAMRFLVSLNNITGAKRQRRITRKGEAKITEVSQSTGFGKKHGRTYRKWGWKEKRGQLRRMWRDWRCLSWSAWVEEIMVAKLRAL